VPALQVSLPFATGGVLSGSFLISLTPAAGHALDLTSLQFDASRFLDTGYGATSATYYAAVRTNLDGFASDVAAISWAAAPGTTDYETFSIDLSAAMFQNLTPAALASVGGALKFEFFFGMTSDPAIIGVNSSVDNVRVFGNTVPEPAGVLLVAIVLAGLLLRRPRPAR